MKWLLTVFVLITALLAFFLFASNDEKKPEYSFVAAKVDFSLPTFAAKPTSAMAKEKAPIIKDLAEREQQVAEKIPPQISNTPVNIEIEQESPDFYQFTLKLQEHLNRGLAVSELEQLYKTGKDQGWPIDWIFEPVDKSKANRNLFELNETANLMLLGSDFEHNFFTLSTPITLPLPYHRDTQIKAFNQKLAQCLLCDQHIASLLTPLSQFELQPKAGSELNMKHKIGVALSSVYFMQILDELRDYDFVYIDLSIEHLRNSENEYLRQHGDIAQTLRNNDPEKLVQGLSENYSMPLASLIPLMKFSLPLSQAQSYQVVLKRLEHEDLNADLSILMDFIIYHGQYFSIDEAKELLYLVQAKQEISGHSIWQTFEKAQVTNFNTVALKWLSEIENNDAKKQLFTGVEDHKGREFNAQRAKFSLLSKMTRSKDITQIQQRWAKGFKDKTLAKTLFSQMNWPDLLENFAITSMPEKQWNKNIAKLDAAQVAHNFDVVSLMQLQIIQNIFYNKITNHHQLDELKLIYPMLLPSEKQWIDRADDSANKTYLMGL